MPDESPDKQINISVDKIQLNQSRIPLDPKTVHQENKMLRKQNLQMKKQLQTFSSRLDTQICKRLELAKKKDSTGNQGASQPQLENAYKKYQIYKKEAMVYRKKYQTLSDDSHIQDLEKKVAENQKENAQFKEEIKQLNKIVKQQSKGLTELGIEDYPSIVNERDQFKQQVRFLKKELDQYRRAHENIKAKSDSFSLKEKKGQSIEKITSIKNELQDKIRKRVRTDNETIKNDQDTVEFLQKRADKNREKVKYLQADRNKMRDLVDNLKIQLAEKEKENACLKDKINELRMNNHLLSSQVFVKPNGHTKQLKARKMKSKQKQVSQHFQPATMQLKQPREKVKKKIKRHARSQEEFVSASQNNRTSNLLVRKQESGAKGSNVIKWSHQHLSSKIKEFQILQHQDGHIKDVHARYEKGEPKKYNLGHTQNYKVFCCSENEYIKYVQGVFDEGYLQFLVVTSSQKRSEHYGKYSQYKNSTNGEHFRFEVGEDEFPGAIFGQYDEFGIKKLGCFIHKEK